MVSLNWVLLLPGKKDAKGEKALLTKNTCQIYRPKEQKILNGNLVSKVQ